MPLPSPRLLHSTRPLPAAVLASLKPRAGFSLYKSCAQLRLASAISNATSSAGEEQGQDRDSKPTRHRRFPVPALALFALALPFGWYFKTQHALEQDLRLAGPHEFARYSLIGRDAVSSTCSIFRLMPAANVAIDLDDPDCERAIKSVQFKQPQLQIARSYTCLPQQQGQHMDELRFLIRKEEKGEVSNFLHRLPVDSEIEVRGLHSDYNVPRDVGGIVFLAGGTGIAPALQVADTLEGRADMHILWASRKREDCVGGNSDTRSNHWTWKFWARTSDARSTRQSTERGALVSMLEDLKRQSRTSNAPSSRLAVDYYVDEEGSSIRTDAIKHALASVSGQDTRDKPGRNILIVSGPEGFVNHWAGPKQWVAGREVQGPLGGILSTLDLGDWEVVKL